MLTKKYNKFWFALLFGLTISITIIIIHDLNESVIPKIVQDINSGVVGAILTTIITLLLLSNQTESQESVTKNSVVYGEKLKIFNDFLSILGSALEDGKLSSTEIQKIIYSYSVLRIHLSEEHSKEIELAIASIDNDFFFVDENGMQNLDKFIQLYTRITNVFRQELYKENKSKTLTEFNFTNLKELNFKPRRAEIPIKSLDGFLEEIRKYENYIYILEDSATTSYKTTPQLFKAFEKILDFLDDIVKQHSSNVIVSATLNKYTIGKRVYLEIPHLKYFCDGKYIACFGISEKNRIYFKRKIPKDQNIFTIEPDEVDNEDLNKYKAKIISFFDEFKPNDI